jgi:hypothetical protein
MKGKLKMSDPQASVLVVVLLAIHVSFVRVRRSSCDTSRVTVLHVSESARVVDCLSNLSLSQGDSDQGWTWTSSLDVN